MEAKAYGTFTKRNGFIYRTDTYIQFGELEEVIGACVLCNPGSSKPKNQMNREDLEGSENYRTIQGEAKIDNTMRQLIKILKGKYGETLEGRFWIFNLFTLVNAKMNDAITELKDKAMDDMDLLEKDYFDYKEKVSSIPWILVGWGCERNKTLNELKYKWLEHLEREDINVIGKRHKDSPHYYHPLPQIYIKKIEYVEDIILQLKSLGQTEKI